jgi:hypothetical protein
MVEQISWQLDGGCRINFSIDGANGADADFFSEVDEIKGALKWLLDADIYGLDNELSKNKICT